jgi:hypothetical protein
VSSGSILPSPGADTVVAVLLPRGIQGDAKRERDLRGNNVDDGPSKNDTTALCTVGGTEGDIT